MIISRKPFAIILLNIFLLANFNWAQSTQQKTIHKNLFIFNSDHDSVKVFINDSLVGFTPLQLNNFPKGLYNLTFVYDTVIVHKYNVEYNNGKLEIFAILKKGKGLFSVYSNEPKAEVYLDSSFIGYTPIIKKYIDVGVHNLSVKLKDYTTWNKRINIHSNFYEYKAKLKYKFGTLTFKNNSVKETFQIDDNSTVYLPSDVIRLPVGKHLIKVASKKFHKKFDDSFYILPKDKLSVKFNYGIKNYNPFLYSAILPGLGQIKDNSPQKGYIIMATNILLGAVAIHFASDYNSKLKEYKNSIDIYNQEFDITSVIKDKRIMIDNYNKAKTALKLKNYSLGAFLISYLYNLADAYLNHSIGGEFIFTTDNNLKTSNILFKYRL